MNRLLTAVLALSTFSGGSATAVTIDFDSLAPSDLVTNQFPEATFSTTAPTGVYIVPSAGFGTSLPNLIAAGATFGDGSGTITIVFTAPVSGLTFNSVGDDNPNSLSIDVFQGVTLTNVVPTIDGDFGTVDAIDLSAFAGITSIVLANTDGGGIGYDDFVFDVDDLEVPAPASLALFGLGVIGMLATRRRS